MFPEELGIKFKDYVNSIKTESYALTDKKTIIPELNKILEDAVSKRTEDKFAIAFSGGLDSSVIAIICSNLKKKFLLISAGLQKSDDLASAQKIAMHYKWPLKIRLITLQEAETIVENVVGILKTNDVVKIGVGCVVYSVLEMAKQNNIKVVLGGLGSEEIFCGYKRHQKFHIKGPESVHSECWHGLSNLYAQDLERDAKIAEHFNIKILAPFLDDGLIKFAMKIDPKLKIAKDDKKIILKEAAVSLGLKEEFAFRKKKAAQYGSYFDKAIEKLAKLNGFKYKKDYLNSILNANIKHSQL